jgi:hypothetical protein
MLLSKLSLGIDILVLEFYTVCRVTTVGPAHRVKPQNQNINIYRTVKVWNQESPWYFDCNSITSEEMHAVSQLVEALRYKSEGRGSIPDEVIGTFPAALSLGSARPLTEMSSRDFFLLHPYEPVQVCTGIALRLPLLLFHSNSGYANALQWYVTRTLPLLLKHSCCLTPFCITSSQYECGTSKDWMQSVK